MALEQQHLDFIFNPISREEMKINIQKEFVTFSKRLEQEQIKLKKEKYKRALGDQGRSCKLYCYGLRWRR